MNNEIKDQDFIQQELAKYSLPDAEIAKMKEQAFALKVESPKDVKNYDLAKSAHQDVKKVRINIERKRTELKASSLEFGRRVDAEAKRLIGKIKEIEDYLLEQRKIVEDEKERIRKVREEQIRAEEEKKKREEEERLEKIRQEQEAKERELKEKEEAIKREQEERERKIKEDQEKIEFEKQAIENEKKRIEDEKVRVLHMVRLEIAIPFKQFWSTEEYAFGTMSETNFQSIMSDLKERKEANDAEVEAQKAKAELVRIAELFRNSFEEGEKAEVERQEALTPDIEKIHEFAVFLMDIKVPDVNNKSAKLIVKNADSQIQKLAENLSNVKL